MTNLLRSAVALLLTTGLLLTLSPTIAQACTCPARLLAGTQGADAVFTGKVEAIEPQSGSEGTRYNRINLAIFQPFVDTQKVLRGDVNIWTPATKDDCGYPFRDDQIYLIYASLDEVQGQQRLTAGLCSTTAPIVEAKDRISCLKALKAKKTSLYVGACRLKSDVEAIQGRDRSLEARSPGVPQQAQLAWNNCRSKNPHPRLAMTADIVADPDKGILLKQLAVWPTGASQSEPIAEDAPLFTCMTNYLHTWSNNHVVLFGFEARFILSASR
ncbi:MAG: hypothetical protein AAFS10_14315 [Myxococcota bacterium]